ncbi:MAG TPA: hypothetical protein VF129_01600 [Actinomycetota bacterium]
MKGLRPPVLDVRDDGVGFDPDRPAGDGSLGHYGLLGMQQRVEMAGGTLAIGPNAPRGTWVHVAVPHDGLEGGVVAYPGDGRR